MARGDGGRLVPWPGEARGVMALYFFDIRDQGVVHRDEVGTDLGSFD